MGLLSNKRIRLADAITAWRNKVAFEQAALEAKAAADLAAAESAREAAEAAKETAALANVASELANLNTIKLDISTEKTNVLAEFASINTKYAEITNGANSTTIQENITAIETFSDTINTLIEDIIADKDEAQAIYNSLVVHAGNYSSTATNLNTAGTYMNDIISSYNSVASIQLQIKTIILNSNIKFTETKAQESALASATTIVNDASTVLQEYLLNTDTSSANISMYLDAIDSAISEQGLLTTSTDAQLKVDDIVSFVTNITSEYGSLTDKKVLAETAYNNIIKAAAGIESLNTSLAIATTHITDIRSNYNNHIGSIASANQKLDFARKVVNTLINDETSSLTSSSANSYTDTQIAALASTAPETLNTLAELAAALGDDPNFATTVNNNIAAKANADLSNVSTLPQNVIDQLRGPQGIQGPAGVTGATGATGVAPTFTLVGTVLTITTP